MIRRTLFLFVFSPFQIKAENLFPKDSVTAKEMKEAIDRQPEDARILIYSGTHYEPLDRDALMKESSCNQANETENPFDNAILQFPNNVCLISQYFMFIFY